MTKEEFLYEITQNNFDIGDQFWIDNYEFEVLSKRRKE